MTTVSPWFQTAQLLAKISKRLTLRSGHQISSPKDQHRPKQKQPVRNQRTPS